MSIQYGFPSQASASPNPSYGRIEDWASILSNAGQGATNALKGAGAYAQNKLEAKEAKRRTLANLMNKATRRNQGLLQLHQQYGGEMNDTSNQALQQIARGFVEAMQGSTGRGYK